MVVNGLVGSGNPKGVLYKSSKVCLTPEPSLQSHILAFWNCFTVCPRKALNSQPVCLRLLVLGPQVCRHDRPKVCLKNWQRPFCLARLSFWPLYHRQLLLLQTVSMIGISGQAASPAPTKTLWSGERGDVHEVSIKVVLWATKWAVTNSDPSWATR